MKKYIVPAIIVTSLAALTYYIYKHLKEEDAAIYQPEQIKKVRPVNNGAGTGINVPLNPAIIAGLSHVQHSPLPTGISDSGNTTFHGH